MLDVLMAKINQLRTSHLGKADDWDDDTKALFRQWEAEIKEIGAFEPLESDVAIQIILTSARNQLKEISRKLQTETTPQKERDRLFIERKWCNWFINFFRNRTKNIEEIERKVDEAIKTIN